MSKLVRIMCLSAVTLLMSACATTFSGQVSSFHEWQAQTSRVYVVERAPDQENNPEYKVYEEQLRRQLGISGFQEADAQQPAAIKVSMAYASNIAELQVSSLHPALYDPVWRLHFRRGLYYGPYWYPYPPLFPSDLSVKRNYLHQLELRFSEVQSGKRLADIKVSTEQLNPAISMFMPDLLALALQDFPQPNGSTRVIELQKTTKEVK